MPGIRAAELWDPVWPRTMHDRLATGFSPLTCGMQRAPVVWGTMAVVGTLNWLRVVRLADGSSALLADDSRLRLISAAGKIVWTRPSAGAWIYQGDLRGNGGNSLLMTAGRRLSLLEMRTGETVWEHRFEPKFVSLRTQVGDICPDRPGLEAAVFLSHGEQGGVINFPPHGEPRFVWWKRVVRPGAFNERYDHHCHIRLDLSQRDAPVIWNVRRYRCRGFDGRTGALLSSIEYNIGGAHRRNYGPFFLGQGGNRTRFACVFGEQVQIHVHAIRLHRQGKNELAWQHYYGEVYKETPGVALASDGVVDVDGDGTSEMIYSVRDPANHYRSFVRIRDVETGHVEFELADHWGCGLFSHVGPGQAAGLLAFVAPAGATPTRGQLDVYRFVHGHVPQRIARFEQARLWGPLTVQTAAGRELLIRDDRDGDRRDVLARYRVKKGRLIQTARSEAVRLLTDPIEQVVHRAAGEMPLNQTNRDQDVYVVASREGSLEGYSFSGEFLWRQPLRGGTAARLSAADLDRDGRAELVAATATGRRTRWHETCPAHTESRRNDTPSQVLGQRLSVISWDDHGLAHQRASYPYRVGWHDRAPAIYDLLGTGELCLLSNGEDARGKFVVRAYRADGSLLWESPLNVAAENVSGCVLTAGHFIDPRHAGVAVSVTDVRRIHEGTTMLDGRSGKVLWQKNLYHDGSVTMPYLPRGIPTAYDFDHDGTEELGIDLLSYMAYLRGTNGDFVYVRPTHNVRTEGAVYAGHLYNTYCPIYEKTTDKNPYWFPTSGFGPFGLMKPDPTKGVWREDLDYDVPPNIALVDVDGDGSLEAGYAARNDPHFVCRDVWTGAVEWTLELPDAPNSPTITADVDGDGKGEFLCGSFCIGTDDAGRGELRWRSPVPLGWPIIADFDGDGQGEIAVAQGGSIMILRAAK